MTGNASVFWLSCFELREPWHPLVYNRWNWVRWAMNWSHLHRTRQGMTSTGFAMFSIWYLLLKIVKPISTINELFGLDLFLPAANFLFLSLICNFLFFVFLHLPNPSLQEPKWKGGGLFGNSPLYSANPDSVGYNLTGGIYTVSDQTVITQCQCLEVLLQWGTSSVYPSDSG